MCLSVSLGWKKVAIQTLALVDFNPKYFTTKWYMNTKDFYPNFDYTTKDFTPKLDFSPNNHIPREFFSPIDLKLQFN